MKLLGLAAVSLLLSQCTKSQPKQEGSTPVPSTPKGKTVYLPKQLWNVPDNNDYNNDASLYSNKRKGETDNFVAYWAKDFGSDPMANSDAGKRFDVQTILKECERFYTFYADTLKFIDRGKSVADLYKILCFVTNSSDQTAYGGGAEDKVGVLWVTPGRINVAPYGAVAHELGHTFQYFVHADGHWGYTSAAPGSNGQAIFEMTSQYMLWQVYPNWMTFENYHLVSFMQQTHYAFLHEINQYHSPYVLEYWSYKHGREFIGKLWKNAVQGEDPVKTYKRLTGIDQKTFNDEIFDASRRFVTWDLPRIEKVAAQYANQHTTKLNSVGNGWYQIAKDKCPQNYGYNAIRLSVPAAGTTVTLQFKGVAGADGFRAINTDKAGWRYGFVAVKQDGSRVYGDTYAAANGTGSFVVPDKTNYLWLVVSGAPTEHWEHITDNKEDNDEQWPYQIKLDGASIDTGFIQ